MTTRYPGRKGSSRNGVGSSQLQHRRGPASAARDRRTTNALEKRPVTRNGHTSGHTGDDWGDITGLSLAHSLNRNQTQVLKFLLFDLPESTMARRTGLTSAAVAEHVRSVYRVFRATTRAELMMRCLRDGFNNSHKHRGPTGRRGSRKGSRRDQV